VSGQSCTRSQISRGEEARSRSNRYIHVMHTLGIDAPDVCLKDEEVVLGTILVNCTQSRTRWHSDRNLMKLHIEGVDDICGQIIQMEEMPMEEQFRSGSRMCVLGASITCPKIKNSSSFSLIALGLIFNHLKHLDGLPQA
jgi:RNA-dependent RNA polymerase